MAIAALTGPLGRRGQWALLAAVVALPWLSVKYAPVAVALVGRRGLDALAPGGPTGGRRRGGSARERRPGLPARPPGGLRRVDGLRRRGPLPGGRGVQRHRPVAGLPQPDPAPRRAAGRSGLRPGRLGPGLPGRDPGARCPGPPPSAAVARRGPAPGRGLGQRHLDRPDHARLVVARPPDRRRPPLRCPRHLLVGRPAGVVTFEWLRCAQQLRLRRSWIVSLAAPAGACAAAPSVANGRAGGDRGVGGARDGAVGLAGGRGAAGAADPDHRLRVRPGTRSTGRGGWCCRTCATRRRSPRSC